MPNIIVNTVNIFDVSRMLKDDPELFQLYRDLVMSGVMTADEFWASRINVSL